MKKFLVITIDVEPDCSPNWRYSSPLSFDGVYEGITKILQPLFNELDFSPTYLINNVVLEDKLSCDHLASLSGSFELGTHLHPEFIEPQKIYSDYAGKKGEANCCFLPKEVEYQKIRSITELFKSRFGYEPQSFRAGRFSAGINTIRSLEALGYKVDTSVTPNVIWDDRTREQPVDFMDAPVQPYRIGSASITDQDPTGSMLEVPVSITRKRSSFLKELKRTRFGLNGKLKAVSAQWLRPVYSSTEKMIDTIETITEAHQYEETLVFNMMFHNVEVMPGLSPYALTEADAQNYIKQLRKILLYCRENNIHGIKLSDVCKFF